MLWALLGLIGISVGAFGALVGVGGGLLLVPILLFLYPNETPAVITSITLAVTFFSTLSGSIAYARLKRIDFRSGLIFALASIPGAVMGAGLTNFLSRDIFQLAFGIILIPVSAYLLIRPKIRNSSNTAPQSYTTRKVTDLQNHVFTYSFSRIKGIAITFGVGFISSLLGIGGGIILVPALVQFLNFPIHIATATTQFVVAATTFAGVNVHILSGVFTEGFRRAAILSATAMLGAQFGARLSQKVPGVLIMRLLAIGLALVGLRLLIAPF